MSSFKKTAVSVAIASALGLGAAGAANADAITSITITGGSFFMSDGVTPGRVPFSFIGPNTDLVGGYINGGVNSPTADPNAIGRFFFFGAAVNLYTAATSNIGGIAGGPVPTGDITGGVLTLDTTSWFANWNGTDFNQGSATASTNFVPTAGNPVPADLAGSASCVGTSCTFTNLEWQSLIVGGPFGGKTGTWTLSGTATIEGAPPVPVPAAVWLFGSGLLGLVGVARRRMK
jgi:hypothetical protein